MQVAYIWIYIYSILFYKSFNFLETTMFIIENNNTIKFGNVFSLKNFSTRTFYQE
jgi:hypothetical protein